MLLGYTLSLLLIGLSGYMLDSHRRAWLAARKDEKLDERDRRFAQAQFRRRTQASAIIGMLGAAIAVWQLIPERPLPMVLYAMSLAGACGCILVLAAIDAWATRQNFVRLRNEQLAAQLTLARDLRASATNRTEGTVVYSQAMDD